MGRPAPDGVARTVLMQVKVTEAGAAEVDRLRGEMTRADFLRKLMREASDRERGKR